MPKLYLIEEYLSFRESLQFTKKLKGCLTDDNYFELQEFLLANPTKGDIIPNGGGLRKIRWRAAGRGKSGGFRVIYYLATAQGYIYFLDIYAKNEKEDLSKEQLRQLSELAKKWLKQ
jgi:hypothetical protein